MRKAADLVVDSAEPIEMDAAEARAKLWTPESEREAVDRPAASGPRATSGRGRRAEHTRPPVAARRPLQESRRVRSPHLPKTTGSVSSPASAPPG